MFENGQIGETTKIWDVCATQIQLSQGRFIGNIASWRLLVCNLSIVTSDFKLASGAQLIGKFDLH